MRRLLRLENFILVEVGFNILVAGYFLWELMASHGTRWLNYALCFFWLGLAHFNVRVYRRARESRIQYEVAMAALDEWRRRDLHGE